MRVGRANRIAVDALGSNLLPVASLQCLIDAYDQRISFGHERLHQQSQQHTARLLTRPASAVENPVVAVESLLLIQAHRAQGGANSSASRSEDRACHEHLNMAPDAL